MATEYFAGGSGPVSKLQGQGLAGIFILSTCSKSQPWPSYFQAMRGVRKPLTSEALKILSVLTYPGSCNNRLSLFHLLHTVLGERKRDAGVLYDSSFQVQQETLLSKRDRSIIIHYLRKWTTVCSTKKNVGQECNRGPQNRKNAL